MRAFDTVDGVTIDNTRALESIRKEIETFADILVEHDQAIVCLVGDNIRGTPGVAARVFGALKDVNVRMISEGASMRNISLVVAGVVSFLSRGQLPEPDLAKIPALGANLKLYAYQLFTTYLLPVQILGFLLLIAMLGVIVLSKKFEGLDDIK